MLWRGDVANYTCSARSCACAVVALLRSLRPRRSVLPLAHSASLPLSLFSLFSLSLSSLSLNHSVSLSISLSQSLALYGSLTLPSGSVRHLRCFIVLYFPAAAAATTTTTAAAAAAAAAAMIFSRSFYIGQVSGGSEGVGNARQHRPGVGGGGGHGGADGAVHGAGAVIATFFFAFFLLSVVDFIHLRTDR
jgi:hypothetical protein